MSNYSRRQFIKTSGGVIAAIPFVPLAGFSSLKAAPSDTLSIGLIGCRSMGYGLLSHALKIDGVVCKGICDVDSNILKQRAADIENETGKEPVQYNDYRKLLDNNDIDAVIIATPDHWHCLQTVHALEAGKHVYVEKPLANSIAESKIIHNASVRSGKVVQVGQQQRSGEHWINAVKIVQSKMLGRIRQINLWGNFGYGQGPKRVIDSSVPMGVNYDMWLGPAPERPFNSNHFHGSWRFFWDYGGGLLTDWGTHLLDIPLWAMNVDGPPNAVSSAGGIYSGNDRAIDMADTQTVIYQFDDFIMKWEHNGGVESGPFNRHYGIAFVGNKGTLIVNREGWEIRPEIINGSPMIDSIPFQECMRDHHDLHIANFIDGIRNGTELNCSTYSGYLSAFYAHIGNIAYRTNSMLTWNENGELNNEADYSHLLTPEYRSPWKLPVI
ncbi:MAG: Gfo/Idh/MocA family oxidoreductase [Bacteroidales bacterium]